ncbi:MAG: carboxypeptidase-like regulatory domain-containing protein [Chryseobacterium sp.]
MTTVDLKITCRIEEVPVLGGFLLSSMQASLADFTGFSPDYNAAFMTTANADLATIEALINPKQLTAELKVITLRMYSNMTALRAKIDLLEGYINRATGLTIGKKDFGISAVRTKNNNGDVEGLLAALSFLLTNVGNNLAALTAKGFTAAQNTALTTLRNDLKADNMAQNNKINDRNNKVIANYTRINSFWDKLVDISDAGKRIYKSTAPNKVDDYTISKLKARIRQERNNTRFDGNVTSGGAAINGAKIVLKPLAGGRKRVTKSKANGTFEILSIEAGDYQVTIDAIGKTPITNTISIITGAPVSKDFDLV